MASRRWRAEDGFIREILWLGLIILIVAVAVLDGLAIFWANQSVKDDALRAARAASTEYVQTQSTSAAKLAAQEALVLADEKLMVILDESVAGVAPGQAVVCYRGDLVVGGGTIQWTAS
jgi:tRNA U34 2-thiouridine synthase MnmA/TrmU